MDAAPRFDVFLSHRSGDKPAVEDLARRLVRRGIEPWLDKWHLIPGTPWQKALEKALAECASAAVCLGPGGTGPWQDEEMRAAINRRVQNRDGGFRVIPVLLPGARKDEIGPLPTFLSATTWVEFQNTLDDEEAFRRLVCGILGIPPGPGPEGVVQGVTPYRGLQYFDVDDSLFFAGRRKLTEELLGKLRSGDRLLAVLGASGSGKSSLVRAGLLASLKQGRSAGSETWPQAILKPGEKPLERLVDALVKALPLADDPIELIGKLGKDPRRLHYTVHQALREAPAERRLVLFVDQFEEVFTLCTDEAQRKALVENLLHASQAEEGRTLVLLTLRTDFFGHCSPDLAEALSNHHVLVGPMTEDDLRSAIERPAALVGCELEPGLTDLLLEEIEDQAGSLPLLEHALLEIWNRRQGRRLTVQAYRDIDGVKGALERHAEEVYGSFSDTEKEVCRRIFLRLVQVSEGTAVTRRRLALSELGEKNQEVARRLIDARLLTTDGEESPTVELAHEALITGWERLKEWIKNDRDALLVRRRLDDAVDEWIAKGRHASYLYQGGRLAQAEEWAERHADEVNESKREFLNASVAQRERESRRLRRLSYGLAAGLFLALIAAGVAFYQWHESVRQRRVLLAQNLAQKVRSAFSSEPSLGVLLAAEAVRLSERLDEPGVGQEESLRWVLSRSRGRALESGRVSGVGTTPDRRFLVTAGMDGAARIWDLTAKDPAISGRFLMKLDEGVVSALALTSDRKWLITRVAEDARVRIYLRNLSSTTEPRELPGEDWFDAGQPFSPDSRWLVTYRTEEVLLRDLRTQVVHSLGNLDLRAAAFSPDSRWLVTASNSGSTKIRDLSSASPVSPLTRERHPEALVHLEGHFKILPKSRSLLERAGSIRFGISSPGNHWTVTHRGTEAPRLVARRRSAFHVEPSTSQLILRLPFVLDVGIQVLAASGNGRFLLITNGQQVFMRNLATKSDQEVKLEVRDRPLLLFWALDLEGSWIAAAREDNDFLLWRRTPEGVQAVSHATRLESVFTLAFSPNGRWLASGGLSGTPLLWDLENTAAEPRKLTYHRGGVTAVAFDPAGRVLATGGGEGSVRLYQLDESEPSVKGFWEQENTPRSGISALVFSPSEEWLILADQSGRVTLWKHGGESISLGNQSNELQSLAFSPNGLLLAGVSRSGMVQFWRLGSKQVYSEPVPLPALQHVKTVSFSSNSQMITSSSEPTNGSFVQIWEMDLDSLLSIACQTVGRNLTRQEWETHLPGEPYDPRAPCPNLPPES